MAQTKSQRIQTFFRSVGDDIKLYHQLLPLLKKQQTLYLAFNGPELSENIRQQVPILNQLSQSAQQRAQCMESLGLPASEQGVQSLLKVLPTTLRNQATRQWQSLHQLVDECQQCNQNNGKSSAAFHEMLSQLVSPGQHTYQEQTFPSA
ncbi:MULTISPECIES: flagellar protein FlgN [Vibrio]|uniref:Flagellar protein FlgN n=1 Tax=Vibrio proteolyticus NBRC 13287 TaxID=1219065 RepID=U2ZEZ1_VIBPR|nr:MULTISPECIES: flagellar protein FlgN [Vibrio]NAW57035.1 flagellar protein FlgN [Vibrio sp. V36_P2S2PM302]NAX22220.1 flagellar protein FlgN [Vibrio sp. V39_P1S14PM300]NAX26436.1 flagellar protein FlgN [Vibrio sp. V38_P2S17PM301]NAX32603.1 flagellar protein FlgN [Vibrio sp. V37_P2S8PM304]GAD66256.1 hypothetical protein VPR01S_03_01650 [Vibrio proteolyticus NBRC 13287]